MLLDLEELDNGVGAAAFSSFALGEAERNLESASAALPYALEHAPDRSN